MQQRFIKSKGKTYLVNCPTEDGIGAGFSVGQLVLKSVTDSKWYVVTASGSAGAVVAFVSQSALPFTATGQSWHQGEATASFQIVPTFFEQNWPYQIVASNNGNAYAIYLTGTASAATITVSQSAYGPAYITSSNGAIIALAKPYLFLQNISDSNYYYAGLTTSASVTSISVNPLGVSQSLVHPIY